MMLMDLNGDSSSDEDEQADDQDDEVVEVLPPQPTAHPEVHTEAVAAPPSAPAPPLPCRPPDEAPPPPTPHPAAPPPQLVPSPRRSPAPAASACTVVLTSSLLSHYADLRGHLTACECPFAESSNAPLPGLSVHWIGEFGRRLPRVAIVIESCDVVRRATARQLLPDTAAAQALALSWAAHATLSVVVVGKTAAGLDRCLDELQLELGVSVRKVLNAKELTELLACHTLTLAKAPAPSDALGGASGDGASGVAATGGAVGGGRAPTSAPDFLAGLTAHDILHNRSVPKSLHAAWLGALKQLLPESAAMAVHAAHPSFRSLYSHLCDAERSGRPLESGLAELRVAGGKRLGPARSRRLVKVLMATRSEAFVCL